jgi:hypothetical protein
MIIPLSPENPELRVRLNQGFADRPPVNLVIRRPESNLRVALSELRFDGCWHGAPFSPSTPETLPALVYPCFDVSDEGDLVFRFDELLWRRPAGRYVGTVEGCDGQVLATIDIDLWGGPTGLTRVEVEEVGCQTSP